MAEPWFDDDEEEEIDIQEELEQDEDLQPSSKLDETSCSPLHHDDSDVD